jgi:hypothetical protein
MDGISYVDAHEVKVKGYVEAVRVVVVVPSEQAKGRRLGPSRRFRGPGRTGLAAIAFASIVVVAFLVDSFGPGLFRGAVAPSPAAAATPSPTPDPLGSAALPLVAFYDPTTGTLKATTHLGRPRNISFYAGGSFWILSENPSAMNRIDPATHELALSIPISLNAASGYSMDDDYLWVTSLNRPEIVRIDQRTGVSQTFTFADPANTDDQAVAQDITSGADSVWISRPDAPNGGEITRIDRLSGKVQKRIPVSPFGLTFGAGSLWWWREGELGRIDPVTDEEAFEPVQLSTETWLGNIYIGGDDAWTAAVSTGQVWRVDRSGRSTVYSLPPGVSELAATEKTMWVTNASTGELIGIDLATGQQDRTIKTGHATVAVSASADELMIAVEPTVDEYIAALEGSGLSLAVDGVPWWEPAPDPALAGNSEVRQLLSITCAGLLGYPDKPGAAGTQLVPEVADGPPSVTGDGRTYTFTIRSGFQFSPPSNEKVTAETFKYTLERALSPEYDDGAPGPNVFGDIVGVEEYRSGSPSGSLSSRRTPTITAPGPSRSTGSRYAPRRVPPPPSRWSRTASSTARSSAVVTRSPARERLSRRSGGRAARTRPKATSAGSAPPG